MMSGVKVVLYSREGCHLCEEVRAQVETLRSEYRFALEEVDVDSDAALLARYGEHVPVVTVNGTEALRHRWSPQRFVEALLRPSAI